MPWSVDYEQITDKVKKSKGNPYLKRGLARFLEDINDLGEGDPAILGVRKPHMGNNVYSYKITRSFRIIYRIDYRGWLITITNIGDHKVVYEQGKYGSSKERVTGRAADESRANADRPPGHR